MGGRRTGGSKQSLCGTNQAAGGVEGASGQCWASVLGAGGQGWVNLVPGGHFHPSHAPLLPDHQGLRHPPHLGPLIPLLTSAFPSTTGKSKDKINKNGRVLPRLPAAGKGSQARHTAPEPRAVGPGKRTGKVQGKSSK